MTNYRPPINFDSCEPLSDWGDIARNQIHNLAAQAADGPDEPLDAAVGRLGDIALGRDDAPAAQRHGSRSAAIDALSRCCDRSDDAVVALARLANDPGQPRGLRAQATTAITEWRRAGGRDRGDWLSVVVSDLQADAACS